MPSCIEYFSIVKSIFYHIQRAAASVLPPAARFFVKKRGKKLFICGQSLEFAPNNLPYRRQL
jgi:hypothetical protein